MEHWVELSRAGTRLGCLDYGGRGPGVLLLHGLLGHAGEWRETASWLTATHRVVAIDQRGHGRSERLPDDRSRAAHVDDALFVIEQLRLAPAALVGQSMGASTAMLLAAAHPAAIERLVVIEGSPDGPFPALAGEIDERLAAWPSAFADEQEARAFLRSRGLAAETWVEGLERLADGRLRPAFERTVMVDCMADLAARGYWAQWESIRCPVLVVVGEHGSGDLEHAQRMADRLLDGRAAEVAGAGHDVHLDAPGALRSVLEPFLGADRPPGSINLPAP